MKSTDSVIVSWDFSRGKDVGVLIVGSQQTGSWLWRQNRTLGRDGRCVYLPKLPGVHF